MFSHILKINPYRDAKGNFTSKDKAVAPGSGKGKTISDDSKSPDGREVFVPDVEGDSNSDGVTDTARVGVPGMSVPPLPKLSRLPNLNEHERNAETKFIEMYEANPDKVAGEFLAMVKASKNPTTFGTDDAKMLTDAWTGEPGEERSGRRQTLNTALHQAANAIAKRAFLQHLDTLKEGDEIMVTVGGCGAGKGYSLGNVPLAQEQASKSKAVWDSAGDQNATENPWIQKEAEKRGLKVTYAYVHANPEVSWADPSRGVIKRANNPNDGRMVDAHVFADSYAIGAKNHAAFVEKNKSNTNAKFIFIDSSKGSPTQVDSMPKEALAIDRKKLASFAVNAVKVAEVPNSIKEGSLAGERIWGATDQAVKAEDKVAKPKEAPKQTKATGESYSWEQYEKDEEARLASLEKSPHAGKCKVGYSGPYKSTGKTQATKGLFSKILKVK